MTKRWPSSNSRPVEFQDLLDPLVDLFKELFEAKSLDKDIQFQGYEWINNKERNGPPYYTNFTLENIAKHKEHGRDIFQVAIALAIGIGMEQGRRIAKEKMSFPISNALPLLALLHNCSSNKNLARVREDALKILSKYIDEVDSYIKMEID